MVILMKTSIFGLLLVAALMRGVFAAGDPTRPPATWLDQPVSSTSGDGSLRLQSVLIPQRGKPVAVIGGVTVVLGDLLGEARLVKLTEREAVLQGADGVTHLYLTPDVKKQSIVTPAPRKTGKSGQGKELR